ncbi:helix-turn-helix domain-containing protein [Bacillus shivajii]|uniref:PucR family transcriptional regulator n=1 Tax=Bacillus shivajii TaxID=1983719 RepID=UPI001CF9ED3B|nr:helix-turn-helix domain-containing protein [Bacillus shivajii]UCZ54291.1 helix-turn-helix domain-containing protein [Bacillus shivajii]
MLNKLKKNFTHAIFEKNAKASPASRLVLQDESGESISLDKTKLSSDEIHLLQMLFDEPKRQKHQTPLHEKLSSYLFNNEEIDEQTLHQLSFPYRLIHFRLKGKLADQDEFEEAMLNLYPSTELLLWKNNSEAILLQKIDEEFDETENNQESIIDTITSDFFVQLVLYTGSPIPDHHLLRTRFKWEEEAFAYAHQTSPTKKSFVEQEVIPHFIVGDLTDHTKQHLSMLLHPVKQDHELLNSIKTYLECNMNTTLAAKKMFMHRNSLQYRVDKFIEKTSIDIKRFPNAIAVYFILIMIQNETREN